jgi:hypothetical protein
VVHSRCSAIDEAGDDDNDHLALPAEGEEIKPLRAVEGVQWLGDELVSFCAEGKNFNLAADGVSDSCF